MCKRLALLLAAGGLILPALQAVTADSVAAVPGINSLSDDVSVFSPNPLTLLNSFTAGDSSFIILALPDGSKYYIEAKAPNSTVTTVDTNFANAKVVSNLQTAATAAALTPDGKELIVAGTTAHIFDTTKDQELVPGGIAPNSSNIFDVAISLDGKKAYVLGTTAAGGSQVNVIDLTTNTLLATFYGVLGTATGITVGPNARVYVTTLNQIIELDPTTLQPTTAGVIGVNARPGKPVFTPDGKYLVAVNQTPLTGSSILLVDLGLHQVVNFVPNNNVVFDTLLVANSTTIFAYSSQNQGLYQLTISAAGSIAIGAANAGGVPTTFVTGVALSNELPFAGNPTAHYLFVASGNILYRVDLTVGQITAQTPLPNQQFTALEYIGLPSTGAPVVLLGYGDKQSIATGATTLPLVVRVLDTNGKPVMGATVTFSANVNTASVSPTSATTGANGFASTTLTGPPTNGTVTVLATAGKQQLAFTVTVGTSSTGPSAGTMIIISGQGQLLPQNTNTSIAGFGSPLTVQVNDVNGKPVSGVTVIFTIQSGPGSLSAIGGTTIPNGAKVNTNSQGQASVGYLSSVVGPGLGHVQTQIVAKATGTNGVTFYENTFPPGPAPQPEFVQPTQGSILTGQAGTTIPAAFVAEIVDTNGLPISGVSVHTCVRQAPSGGGVGGPGLPTCGIPAANASVPFGTCNDPTGQGVISDAHGKLTCDLNLNGIVGTGAIAAEYGDGVLTQAFPLKITPGPPGAMTIIQGNNQTGKPGQQLPIALVVQVQDGFGNVLPFVPMSWQVLNTGVPATLQNASTATDGAGNGSTLVTLGPTNGTVIIQASAGNASASFSLTVSNPAAGVQIVSGNNQTAVVGAPFAALVVKVVDGNGNGVSGAAVTFAVSAGSATVATPSTTTDPTGQASTAATAGNSPGNITIVATSGNFTVTFTLSSHLAGPQNIIFVNGTNFKLQNGCPAPGCVAPGEVITVEGSGFATGVPGVVSGLSILGPLPTSLAGVSITFNGVAAPIFYVANVNGVESMTIQVPFETQVGTAAVVLNAAGGGSGNFNVPVQLYAPGVFTSTYGNQVIAVAVRPDGSYVSPNNPAHLGETIIVFVTGLGQTSPPATTNQPGAGQAVTATVITGLNNAGVPHTNIAYAQGLVGVYLISVQVPATTKTGPNQPFGLILVDSAGNKYYAFGTFLPIAP